MSLGHAECQPAGWNSAHPAEYIENTIFTSLKPGAIILMRVNSAHGAGALGAVIEGVAERAYAIAPLGQLLA